MAGNYANLPVVKPMRVSADGQSAEFTFDITGRSADDMGWTRHTWSFVADDGSATLEFKSLTCEMGLLSGWGPALDNVSVTEMLCGDSPREGCLTAGKASFQVNEKKVGMEKLKGTLKNLTVATTQASFGNPISGATRYTLCVYNQVNSLVAHMQVARAGQLCGDKPCWKVVSKGKGYQYADKTASADGITKISGKSGEPNKGKVDAKGQNNASKGQTSLPTGIAAALQANSQATVQILTSDASCFGATMTKVTKADGLQFKAELP